jgi:hypothetical protein
VAVLPAHEVGRRSIVAEGFQDFTVALQLALMVPPDHQAIAWLCAQSWTFSHRDPSLLLELESLRRGAMDATFRRQSTL